jgi:KaiC/GvpD/RAD55 family RecA-like ATPase
MIEPERIDLGKELNHLLNRNTKLGVEAGLGGLPLPVRGKVASTTSVVVIIGRPGTGKSTLALQILVEAARQSNPKNLEFDPSVERIDSVYLSLEDRPSAVQVKAQAYKWEDNIFVPGTPPVGGTAEEKLADVIKNRNRALDSKKKDLEEAKRELKKKSRLMAEKQDRLSAAIRRTEDARNKEGVIIAASLLPRPVHNSRGQARDFFQEQYRYLEELVKAAAQAPSKTNDPRAIRAIVIDSLNMLSYTGQTRESMYRIFDLFRANGILGILTVDDGTGTQFDSTMADVVFAFSEKSDSSYLIRHISIQKSRHTPTSYGLHPYKFNSNKGIEIFPSLHAVVAATTPDRKGDESKSLFPFGWGSDLTSQIVRVTLKGPGVVTLHGPNGTRKSSIAGSFLVHGLVGDAPAANGKKSEPPGESGIYIRLKDAPENADFNRLLVYDTMSSPSVLQAYPNPALKKAEPKYWGDLLKCVPYSKGTLKIWAEDGKFEEKPVLAEIGLHTGMLLPEEFVQIVMDTYLYLTNKCKKRVQRVVVDDISVIGGGSYPLLERSQTTADLFLPAFVHVLRNHRVHLMLVGTDSKLQEGNKIVDRAITIADAVIETRIRDVFGDRYILLMGDGAIASHETGSGWVPPALLMTTKDGEQRMRFDTEIFKGLVGFDGEVIARSKICAYLYHENQTIHGRYSETLPYLLEPICGLPVKGDSGLQVIPFQAARSDTIHRSVAFVHKDAPPPRDHTVLATIDEFGVDRNRKHETNEDKRGQTKGDRFRYTNNVLLLVWLEDAVGEKASAALLKRTKGKFSWRDLAQLADELWGADRPEHTIEPLITVERSAPETLTCCLIDCLLSGWRLDGNLIGKGDEPLQNTWADVCTQLGRISLTSEIVNEVSSLNKLFWKRRDLTAKEPDLGQVVAALATHRRDYQLNSRDLRLVPEKFPAVQIIWYSQLRFLINAFPSTCSKIRVAPLPAGGFKGDWWLRVLPGSVSNKLGEAVARELTKPEEDYRRFRLGLGLPAHEDPRDRNKPLSERKWHKSGFRAWPGAAGDSNVQLKNIYQIHERARKRSTIDHYPTIAPILNTFARRLAGDWDEQAFKDSSIVAGHLRRLPDHLDTLTEGLSPL